MSTFQEVNDASLIKLIGEAQQRVVFVAPGVHQTVAEALGQRLAEVDQLQVTVVIDPDEDVCRIGYGDAKGLELLSSYADRQSFALMAQPGSSGLACSWWMTSPWCGRLRRARWKQPRSETLPPQPNDRPTVCCLAPILASNWRMRCRPPAPIRSHSMRRSA